MRHFACFVVTYALVFAAPIPAQHPSARPGDSLTAISDRGRRIAAYDFASWHGTDAVMALGPAVERITHFIAQHTPEAGWRVSFGKLSARRDTFHVAYEAVRTNRFAAFEGFEATAHDPPRADTGYLRRAALALDVARTHFGTVTRPYNAAVLPNARGWWVYLMPAPTRAGVWPLGADVRYLISPDGTTLIEQRRLHNTVLEFAAPRGGRDLAAFTHTAVLDTVPEDTDVFHVLVRTPKVPQYVITEKFTYRINVDGSITKFGRREDPLSR